jgi:hypothetical protein
MTLNTFVPRIAQVTVTINRPDAQGNVTPQTFNYQANRMKIRIRDGGAQFGNCHLELYGVPLAEMNQIARLYLMPLTPQNTDTVSIGVWDGYNFVPLFQGVVSWSAIDAGSLPGAALIIESNSSFGAMNTPAAPYTNNGAITLQNILQVLAGNAGYTVDYSAQAPQYTIQRVRLTGSAMDQIRSIMSHFPDMTFNVHLQRLIVRSANQPFDSTQNAIQISAATGMSNAPVYSTNGVSFTTLFNPQITPGSALAFTTQFSYLNQTQWVASVLQHDLEPNVFQGKWISSVAACAFGKTGNTQ